jgi:hypothetical protein
LLIKPVRGLFHLSISITCWLRVIREPTASVYSGVFTVEEVDGVRDKGSGDNRTVEV